MTPRFVSHSVLGVGGWDELSWPRLGRAAAAKQPQKRLDLVPLHLTILIHVQQADNLEACEIELAPSPTEHPHRTLDNRQTFR